MSKNKFHFPEVVGEDIEMYVEGQRVEGKIIGKWVKGKVIEGYRFRDGIVTIEDKHGNQYWCGQDREDLYRPCKKKKNKKKKTDI